MGTKGGELLISKTSDMGPRIFYFLLLLSCFGLFVREATECTKRFLNSETTVLFDAKR